MTGSLFVLNTCGKDIKTLCLFVPPPLKANAYPFGVHVRFEIKPSLGSLCVKVCKREMFRRTEKIDLAKLIQECLNHCEQKMWNNISDSSNFSLSIGFVIVPSEAVIISPCITPSSPIFYVKVSHHTDTHKLISHSLKGKKKDNITTSCVSAFKFDSHELITHEAWTWQAPLSPLKCSQFINTHLIEEICHNFREVRVNDVQRDATVVICRGEE